MMLKHLEVLMDQEYHLQGINFSMVGKIGIIQWKFV
jgi:hypothetical protein